MSNECLSRKDLATRWKTSVTTIDRLRAAGRLPWFDVSTRSKRTTVCFRIQDVEHFERQHTTPEGG